MKAALVSLLFFLGMLFFVSFSYAADFNIACTEEVCNPEIIPSFFPSTELWFPSKSLTKSILMQNNSRLPAVVKISAFNFTQGGETADLSKAIQLTIIRQSDNEELWTGSLYSFYHSEGAVLYDVLTPGTSTTLLIRGEMYATAGNEYQGASTQFDLLFAISDKIPTRPPPQCAIKASDVPSSISLTQGGSYEVKVGWAPINDGASGYEISWGTDENADNKGTKSVGLTSETSINGFDLRSSKYYFKIRSVTDCAKSNWSKESSIGESYTQIPEPSKISSTNPAQDIPTPTSQQVAVATNPPNPTLVKESGESVKGASTTTNTDNRTWTWYILPVEILSIALYIGIYKYVRKKGKFSKNREKILQKTQINN